MGGCQSALLKYVYVGNPTVVLQRIWRAGKSIVHSSRTMLNSHFIHQKLLHVCVGPNIVFNYLDCFTFWQNLIFIKISFDISLQKAPFFGATYIFMYKFPGICLTYLWQGLRIESNSVHAFQADFSPSIYSVGILLNRNLRWKSAALFFNLESSERVLQIFWLIHW